MDSLLRHIDQTDYQAYDVETTGLNVRKDKIIGYGITGTVGMGYYVPFCEYNPETGELDPLNEDLDVLEPLRRLKQIVTWNGSFDGRFTKNDLGVNLIPNIVSEVMLMKHTLQEEGPFKLKENALEFQHEIGIDAEKEANEEQLILIENIKQRGGSVTKTNFELYKAEMEIIGTYCCADVDLTLRLHDLFYDRIEREGLWDFFYHDEVMPLYREVTIPMEEHGVAIDMDYLVQSKVEITEDMNKLHSDVLDALEESKEFQDWLANTATAKFPAKPTGSFGQGVAKYFELDLPVNEKGKYSLAKKNIEKLPDSIAKSFLLKEDVTLDQEVEEDIAVELWKKKNDGFINISSKKQMGELAFDYYGYKPLSKTDKGAPQFNETMINYLADDGLEWARKLRLYNKLVKIKSSYIMRFLDNQEDGYYYFSYKQHGTISGRYGSDAQQMPRPMEEGEDDPIVIKYANRVRKFFIAGEDRKLVDCDYESLEPHTFAHVARDEGLKNIFRSGHDFYSTIAIATEKIDGVSADKKAENYLGKVDKPRRQTAKAYSLGVPYGMTSYALAMSLDVEVEEADELIDGYLGAYPELKKWMDESNHMAQHKGYVRSQAGRIRHLPKVMEIHKIHGEKMLDFKYRNKITKQYKISGMSKDEAEKKVKNMYLDYKNGLNNAKNVQIQSLAGSIVNRAAIAVTREFKKRGIDGWCAAQIHDQLIFNVPDEKKEECRIIVQELMENTTKLDIDLKAPAELGDNWYEAH